MKGGKHSQGPRGKDAPVKGKSNLRGAPGQQSADRPKKGVAPKKGTRKKPFGGSSSAGEE